MGLETYMRHKMPSVGKYFVPWMPTMGRVRVRWVCQVALDVWAFVPWMCVCMMGVPWLVPRMGALVGSSDGCALVGSLDVFALVGWFHGCVCLVSLDVFALVGWFHGCVCLGARCVPWC